MSLSKSMLDKTDGKENQSEKHPLKTDFKVNQKLFSFKFILVKPTIVIRRKPFASLSNHYHLHAHTHTHTHTHIYTHTYLYSTNTLGKGMNPIILTPALG